MPTASDIIRSLKSLKSTLNSSYDSSVDSDLAEKFNELLDTAEKILGKDFDRYAIRDIDQQTWNVKTAGGALDAALTGSRGGGYPKQKLLTAINGLLSELE